MDERIEEIRGRVRVDSDWHPSASELATCYLSDCAYLLAKVKHLRKRQQTLLEERDHFRRSQEVRAGA